MSFQFLDHTWTLFLDRDGVINKRLPGTYVKTIDEFSFTPNALSAFPIFQTVFNKTIVVTNQQGIGKGIMTKEDLIEVHEWMSEKVEASGGRFDAIYYCAETAIEDPFCRKPKPGMALKAKRVFPSIHFEKSMMVGDSKSDIEFGQYLGMRTVWIKGKEEEHQAIANLNPDFSFDSLFAFAEKIKKDLNL